MVWKNRERGRISTPIAYRDKLYFVAGGILNTLDAKTGKRISQVRLGASRGGGSTRGGSGRGGGSGRRGGGGGQDYSSPIIAGGKLYFVSRNGATHVVALPEGDEKPEVIATNRFESDNSSFSATPAVSKGALVIRSDRFVYYIGETEKN